MTMKRKQIGLLALWTVVLFGNSCVSLGRTRFHRATWHTAHSVVGLQWYEAPVRDGVRLNGERFDSVGLNYVLHCLPGIMLKKAIVFENIQGLLRARAKIISHFRIPSSGHLRSLLGRKILELALLVLRFCSRASSKSGSESGREFWEVIFARCLNDNSVVFGTTLLGEM